MGEFGPAGGREACLNLIWKVNKVSAIYYIFKY